MLTCSKMAPSAVPRGGLRPIQSGPQSYLLLVLLLLVVVLAFNYWSLSTKNAQLLDELSKVHRKYKTCLDDIRRQKNDILQSERGRDNTRNEINDLNEKFEGLKHSEKRHIEKIEACGRNISKLLSDKRRLEIKCLQQSATGANQNCQELIQANKNNLEEMFLKEKDKLKQKINDQTNELQKQQERMETLQKTIEAQSIKLRKLPEYEDKQKNNDPQGQQNQDVIQGQGRKLKETPDEAQYQNQGQQAKEKQDEGQNQNQGQAQNQNQGQQVKEKHNEGQNQNQGQQVKEKQDEGQNQNQGQAQNQNQGQQVKEKHNEGQNQNQGQQVKEKQVEGQNQNQGQALDQNQGQQVKEKHDESQNQNQGQGQNQNQGQHVKETQDETQYQNQGQQVKEKQDEGQNQNQAQAQDQNQGQQVKEKHDESQRQKSQQKQNFEKTETSQPLGPTNSSSMKIDADHVPGSRPAHWIEGARRPGDPVHVMQHGSTGLRSADAFTGTRTDASGPIQNGSAAKATAVDGHKGILSNVQDAGYKEEMVGKPGNQEVAGSPGQLGAIKHSNTGESKTNKEQKSVKKNGEIIEQNEKGKSAPADSGRGPEKVEKQE